MFPTWLFILHFVRLEAVYSVIYGLKDSGFIITAYIAHNIA